MQTLKNHNIGYSLIKLSETGDRIRLDADFYDFDFLNRIEKVKGHPNDKLGNRLEVLTDYHANGSYLTLRDNVEIKDAVDYALIVRTTDLEKNDYTGDVKYITENAYNFLTKTKVFGGEIIINKIGSAGKVYLMPVLNRPVSLGMNAFLLRIKALNTKYLYIYLLSSFGEKIIQQKINGAVPLSIDKASVRDIDVPIPSTEFQQKIEELVVKSYEEKEKSESLYKEAENILLQELNLLDFQPSTKEFNLFHQLFTIENNSSIIKHSDLIETDRLDAEYWDSKYLEIQERIDGIETQKLSDLVDYKKGIEVGTGKYIEDSETESIDDKKYFIRISNISKQGLSFGSPKYITNETFEDLSNYKPEQGEILFSKDGTAGITYLLREGVEGIISGGILRLQNKSDISSEYIELVLNSILIQSEIEKTTNGALIQHLKIENALGFNIPIVSEEKRNTITDKIQQSFIAKEKSKKLLDVAKRGVEIYIEETEAKGLEYINENL